MTKEILFFDTDCLSAFLWVNEESILPKLYPGKIVIPQKVYEEISNPKITHLKARVDMLVSQGLVTIQPLLIDSDEYELYTQFTHHPESGFKIIGEGEAASLAMAASSNGVVASNNLKDIMQYIKKLNLKHLTTGDILIEAYNSGLITKIDGENIWKQMISKRRKLGANSFEEYMETKKGEFSIIARSNV